MNRRTELRRTPLVARTPLCPSSKPMRRTPLNPVSARRSRENGQRRVVVSAMRALSTGRCPRCGEWGRELHGHERRGRGQGQSILEPDVLLCNPCNGWCEDNPQVAAFTGWKVSAKWRHDSALTSAQARDLAGVIVDFTMPWTAQDGAA